MSVIIIDRIGAVVIQNGILRVDCLVAGPNGEERPAGTLIIPANQVGTVLQSLVGAAQEIDRRLRDQTPRATPAEAAAPVASADTNSSAPAADKKTSRAKAK